MKKKIFGILILIILIISFVLFYYFNNSDTANQKFKKAGYSTNEISQLKKSLKANSLEIILEYEYNENIFNIINENYFIEDNLSEYIKYLNKYKDASPADIVFIINNDKKDIEYSSAISELINHKDFKLENLDRYISYHQKYNLIADKTITAVNKSLDKDDIELDDITALFLGKEYYLQRNLNRYKEYYEKNSKLNIDEIIARVNSNLDKTFYLDISATDMSNGNLILVNKYYHLSNNYVPPNLVTISSTYGSGQISETTYNAFIKMYNAAAKEKLYLYISSPYRSYSRQSSLYTNYVSKDGKTNADTYSARPGHSEHQTGLAIDLGTSSNHSIGAFEKSKEFTWTKNNAHKYGFILRYPKGKEYITGYISEPWHYRYVGIEVATYIYEHNITFEEYYEYFIK
jgi:D-alanyl-D-alanine carboxypeptidase